MPDRVLAICQHSSSNALSNHGIDCRTTRLRMDGFMTAPSRPRLEDFGTQLVHKIDEMRLKTSLDGARPLQIYPALENDPRRLLTHDKNPVRQIHCFAQIVGHQNGAEAMLQPQCLHDAPKLLARK